MKRDDLEWLKNNISLNLFNYRNDDFKIVKPSGVYRIYILGDSNTFGWYINSNDQIYSKILEKKLQEKYGQNIEVINASKHGFSLDDEITRFKQEGVRLNPDLVIVTTKVWDNLPNKIPKPLINNTWINNLMLYKLTLGKLDQKRTSDFISSTVRENYGDNSVSLQMEKQKFIDLKKTTDSINAKLVIVSFPEYENNTFINYPFDLYQQQINKIANYLGVLDIDLKNAFSSYKNISDLILNPDDPHPSVLGHQLIADYIFQKLQNLNFVGASFNEKSMSINSANLTDIIMPLQSNSSWLFFDSDQQYNNFLPLPDNRQVKYLDNFLMTAKPGQDGWVGAKLQYYVEPKNNMASIPKTLFGYQVVGFNNVVSLWREDGSLNEQEQTLDSLNISDKGDTYLINLKQKRNLDLLKLTLDLSNNEFEIKNKQISLCYKTMIISSNLNAGTTHISIPLSQEILSLPKYLVEGKTYGYAWINGQITKVNFSLNSNEITVDLPVSNNNSGEIHFPVSVQTSPPSDSQNTFSYF